LLAFGNVMKVLVTGGCGFLGRHLVKQLQQEKIPIVVCGRKPSSPFADTDVTYVQCDLLKSNTARTLCAEFKPTHIIHLAWDNSSNYWTSEANFLWLEASTRLIKEFYNNGGEYFLGAGTCVEYSPIATPRNEEDTPTNPNTIYGKAKLALCKNLDLYSSLYEKKYMWARVFYMAGEYDKDSKLIPSFLKAMKNEEKFICNNSKSAMDYLDVRDVARALALMLISSATGVCNIASGNSLRIRDLLTDLATTASFPLEKITFEQTKLIEDIIGNNSKLSSLGFKPKYSLAETFNTIIRSEVEKAYG